MFELVDIDADGLEQQITRLAGSLLPDGVILTPPISDDETVLSVLRRRKIPMVRLGAHSPGPGPRVYMDDDAAAECLTRHLLDLGHRRIGFIAGSFRFQSSQRRVETFQRVMSQAGVPIQDAWLQRGDFTYQSGLAAAEALLKLDPRPTAIQASNDEMALGALHAAQRLGVSVPEQLSIVSYDDTRTMLYSNPPITAVRHPTAAMAAKAAELLLDANTAGDKSDIAVPFEFIQRASCAPPAG
jgi:LacI family transcriptional regulator